jgi:hypothetical protein
MRRVLGVLAAAALATTGFGVALVAVGTGAAAAAGPCVTGDIVVSTSADSGTGSLRQAFADANTAGSGTICIDTTVVTAPITITSGDLEFNAAGVLTIHGNGATIQGNGTSGLLYSSSTELFEVDDVTVTGGSASSGAAVRNGNGEVKVVRSTITGNTATSFGAGVSGVVVTVVDSTIADNTVTDGDGAGINAGTATVINSTITGNHASTVGGGIEAGQDITLVYATVVGNSAPDGANVVLNNDTALASFGSVVTDPSGGGVNCEVVSTSSNGYNYSDDDTCGFTDTTKGDVENGPSPQLGALADNGGPTATLLPADTSPLVDAIPTDDCQLDGAAGITTDQRGVIRPQVGGCDVGAVELVPPPPIDQPPPPPPPPVTVTPRFTG